MLLLVATLPRGHTSPAFLLFRPVRIFFFFCAGRDLHETSHHMYPIVGDLPLHSSIIIDQQTTSYPPFFSPASVRTPSPSTHSDHQHLPVGSSQTTTILAGIAKPFTAFSLLRAPTNRNRFPFTSSCIADEHRSFDYPLRLSSVSPGQQPRSSVPATLYSGYHRWTEMARTSATKKGQLRCDFLYTQQPKQTPPHTPAITGQLFSGVFVVSNNKITSRTDQLWWFLFECPVNFVDRAAQQSTSRRSDHGIPANQVLRLHLGSDRQRETPLRPCAPVTTSSQG
jgi:hypothetical protein